MANPEVERIMSMGDAELFAEFPELHREPYVDRFVVAQRLLEERRAREKYQRDREALETDDEKLAKCAPWRFVLPGRNGNASEAWRDQAERERYAAEARARFTVAPRAQIVTPQGKILLCGAELPEDALPMPIIGILVRRGALIETSPEVLHARTGSRGFEYIVRPDHHGLVGGIAGGHGITSQHFARAADPPRPARAVNVRVGDVLVPTQEHAYEGRPASDGRAEFDHFIRRGLIVRNPNFVREHNETRHGGARRAK